MSTATITTLKGNAQPFEVGQAPAEASRLEAKPFQFAAVDDASDGTAPIELLARTGDVLEHWYWGRIVHDNESFNRRPRIPIDFCHGMGIDDQIGYLERDEVRDGDLYLFGALESVEAGDIAAKLIAKAQRGIPFQASIDFDVSRSELEFVPEGMFATINGREIEGPTVVVRNWQLRAVAVCPHGHDVGTEAKFNASNPALSLNWSNQEMTKKPAEKAAEVEAEKLTAEATEAEATATETESPKPEAPAQTFSLDEARQQAQLFSEKFGKADGFDYFQDGLSLQDAALKHVEKLTAKCAELQTAADTANQKLAAAKLSLGQAEAVPAGKPQSGDGSASKSVFRRSGS